MISIEFPIYGPLRIPLLIIEWVIAIISFELGIILFMRYTKYRSSQEFGFSSFLFSYSIMRLLLIIGDYFSSDFVFSPFLIWGSGSVRDIFLNFGYISLITGTFFLSFFIEKYKKYFYKKYFFTFLFLSLIASFFTIFWFNLDVIKISIFIYGPIFLVFVTLYFIDFFKNIMKKENIFIDLVKIIPAVLFLTIGFVFSLENAIKL
ncbi:MAG: hypothetical protein ACFFCM_17785, partial [Promethearchaeota archaeon]